jgi:predicted amidophosphoribosyltransferase
MKRRLSALWQHLTANAGSNSGQCSVCQGWFDNWPGGICAACLATGRS